MSGTITRARNISFVAYGIYRHSFWNKIIFIIKYKQKGLLG